MKKVLFLIAAVACIAMTSCSKQVIGLCGYDATAMVYYGGDEGKAEAEAFLSECTVALNKLDGTEFTEKQFINTFSSIVSKYDHKHLEGPFKLWRDETTNVIKTFNMVADLKKSDVEEAKPVLTK